MEVFRICKNQYSRDLSGNGAKLAGGRWNRKGVPVLYTSGSVSLATLEVLVLIPATLVPSNFSLVEIVIPDHSISSVETKNLPEGWDDLIPLELLKTVSDKWITENKFLVLKVPSIIVRSEFNYLIYPQHEDFKNISVKSVEPFRFDERLVKI